MKCLFFLMPAFSVVQLVSGIGLHLAGSPDEILRPGYGVVFEKEGKMLTDCNSWLHSFIFDLPKYEDLVNEDLRFQADELFTELLAGLQYLKNKTEDIQNRATKEIRQLKSTTVENPNDFLNRPKKTGNLNIMQSPWKSHFGTARTDDLDEIALKIRDLISHQSRLENRFHLQEEMFQTYMKIEDDRMRWQRKMISSEITAVIKLAQKLSLIKHNEQNSIDEVALKVRMYTANKIAIDFLSALEADIKQLTAGHLSRGIIPLDQFAAFFEAAIEALRFYGWAEEWQFEGTEPMSYYRKSSYMLTLHNNSIWITMKFDIGKPISFYRVKTWAVPIGGKYNIGTTIQDLPEYIGLDYNNRRYTLLKSSDFVRHWDQNQGVMRCHLPSVFISFEQRSCTTAILLGFTNEINSLCSVTVEVGVIRPAVVPLTMKKVLIQDFRNVDVTCKGVQKQRLQGCKTCILNLPCDCVIKTYSSRYRTETKTKCEQNTGAAQLYFKNIAFFSQFFKETAKEMRPTDLFTNDTNKDVEILQIEEQLLVILKSDSRRNIKIYRFAEILQEKEKEIENLSKQCASMFYPLLMINFLITVVIISFVCFCAVMIRRIKEKQQQRKRWNSTDIHTVLNSERANFLDTKTVSDLEPKTLSNVKIVSDLDTKTLSDTQTVSHLGRTTFPDTQTASDFDPTLSEVKTVPDLDKEILLDTQTVSDLDTATHSDTQTVSDFDTTAFSDDTQTVSDLDTTAFSDDTQTVSDFDTTAFSDTQTVSDLDTTNFSDAQSEI